MEIESIGSVDGPSALAASLMTEWAHHLHPSPAATALAEAKAKEQATPEQLAAAGDPIALAHLQQQADRLTPIQSQGLEPPAHPAGAHEPGKGELIDLYD